jgi:hypothetical protein
VLDFSAGVVYEGEAPPQPEPGDAEAIHVWNMLQNGMGGLDWSGLPVALEVVGVDDVEALIARLMVVKAHKPPKEEKE